MLDKLVETKSYLTTGQEPNDYTYTQHRQPVAYSANYRLIVGHMYKLGIDEILCRSTLHHERAMILYEAHEGITWGLNVGKAMVHKVLHMGLWWPLLFVDAKEYYKQCDIFQ
jgi:hypothetical protein